jgi:hypothetical protein
MGRVFFESFDRHINMPATSIDDVRRFRDAGVLSRIIIEDLWDGSYRVECETELGLRILEVLRDWHDQGHAKSVTNPVTFSVTGGSQTQ